MLLIFLLPIQTYATENTLFEGYLQMHPEFKYGTWIDLNGDGVYELLLSDRDNRVGRIRATLCVLSADGQRIFSWNLYSQYAPFTYDPKENAIVGDGGGTGIYELCAVQLNHDELIALRGKYYQLYTGAFELE